MDAGQQVPLQDDNQPDGFKDSAVDPNASVLRERLYRDADNLAGQLDRTQRALDIVEQHPEFEKFIELLGLIRRADADAAGAGGQGAGPRIMAEQPQPTQPPQPTKPGNAARTWKVITLMLRLRFADAVEYANSGDTEN